MKNQTFIKLYHGFAITNKKTTLLTKINKYDTQLNKKDIKRKNLHTTQTKRYQIKV